LAGPKEKTKKIIVIYASRTGNTENLAQALAEGARKVPGITVELRNVGRVDLREVAEADGYAFGSPSHFSMMSGEILTLFTNLYPLRDKMAGKPACVFTTGVGGQVTALENIERILGAFNPKFIKPGLAIEGAPRDADKVQAEKLGRKLAEAVTKK